MNIPVAMINNFYYTSRYMLGINVIYGAKLIFIIKK